MENASREFSSSKVKEMIEAHKKKDWEFLFIGANIDAVETASRYGISSDRAVNYNCDSEGTGIVYEELTQAVSEVRRRRPLSKAWGARISEDYKRRGK
jgi:hypothetical protein